MEKTETSYPNINSYSSTIGGRDVFKLEVRRGKREGDIFTQMTAHTLRERIQEHFDFEGKQVRVLQVRYNVIKEQAVIRYEQSLRNRRLDVIPAVNQISGNWFLDSVFAEAVKLVQASGAAIESETLQESTLEKKEKENIKAIDDILQRTMASYNDKSIQRPESNQFLWTSVDGLKDKISCSMVVLTHKNMYDSLKNYIVKFDKNCVFLDHPKTLEDRKDGVDGYNPMERLRMVSTLYDWGLGTVEAWKSNADYYSSFDFVEMETKLTKQNSSIRCKTVLLKELQNRVSKFEILSELFGGGVIKMDIDFIQIESIVMDEQSQPGQTTYYIKLLYPPRYYITLVNRLVSTDIGYMGDWTRIENFPVIRDPSLAQQDILRLHVFNNTILKIDVRHLQNPRSRKTLQDLFSLFKVSIVRGVLNKKGTLKILQNKLNLKKFQEILLFRQEINPDELWNLKYFVMSMVSAGLLAASEVLKLMNFVEDNFKYHVFFYIFRKLCSQTSKKGFDYIVAEYESLKNHPQKFLEHNTSEHTVLINRLALTPSGILYLAVSPQMSNRMLREYSEFKHHFLRASIQDDNTADIRSQPYLTKKFLRGLMSGFSVLDRQYLTLGWSPSQLRTFSIWYVHETGPFKRDQILNFLGNFENIRPVAKQAARIVNEHGQLFTDGVGSISKDLINKITLKFGLDSTVGILQMRYKGAKGILVIDPSLPKSTICLRPSMIKYKNDHSHAARHLDILDWNKYKAGYLNRQIIILLRTLGIHDKVFIDLQNRYIDDIQALTFKECSVFVQFTSKDDSLNIQPANKAIFQLARSGFQLDKEPYFKGVLKILKRNGYQKLKEKSSIKVEKSARVIGIIDQYGILEEGQLYCSLYNTFDTDPKNIAVVGPVLIVRNPCLHPGDIRKMVCKGDAEMNERFLEKLKKINSDEYKKALQQSGDIHPFKKIPNSVVFPQKGIVPVTCEISGSDLDGDNFFICWDPLLIPENVDDPYLIDSNAPKPKLDQKGYSTVVENYDKMLDFFTQYMNYEKLGKIANSHLVRADQDIINYARSNQCIELSKAHGHAVDFPKSGYCPEIDKKLFVSQYPDFMEKTSHPQYRSESVLGILYRDIKERMQKLIAKSDDEAEEVHIDEQLCQKYITKGAYSDEEIKQAILACQGFECEISNIRFLAGLSNEFEIYTGNITGKDNTRAVKNSRLTEQIVNLKSKFLNVFYSGNEVYIQRYLKASPADLTGKYFTEQEHRKAVLWYIVSYLRMFEELKSQSLQDQIKILRRRVYQLEDKVVDSERAMGLAWFVVSTILAEVKKSSHLEEAKISCDVMVDEQID